MSNKCEDAFFNYLLTADPATDPEYKKHAVDFLREIIVFLENTNRRVLNLTSRIEELEKLTKEQEFKINHLQSYLNY